MKLSFDQLFYGRGERGYAILGASPGAEPLVARVETLCGAIGTPGGDYGGEPFLLSVSGGDHIIMICGRRGAPDSMGRGTLFFHALVAAKVDLAAAKVDAFALFEQGAFADKMPTGEIKALRIDAKPGRDGSPSRPAGGRIVDASLPCIIRSDKPAPNLVRAVLAGRVNDCAWSTFAFQFLDGFTAQVLPACVAAPRTANEYDSAGNLLRSASARQSGETRRIFSDDVLSGRDGSTSRPSGERVIDASPPPGKSPMLKFSLAANAVLAVLCAMLYTNRKPLEQVRAEVPVEKVVEKLVEVPPSQTVTNEIAKAAVERYRNELVASFPQNSRIQDFETEHSVIPGIAQYKADNKKVKEFLLKVNQYILFVNKTLTNTNLTETTQP